MTEALYVLMEDERRIVYNVKDQVRVNIKKINNIVLSAKVHRYVIHVEVLLYILNTDHIAVGVSYIFILIRKSVDNSKLKNGI